MICDQCKIFDGAMRFRTGSESRLLCPWCINNELRSTAPDGSPWWTLLGFCVICATPVYWAKSSLKWATERRVGITCSSACSRKAHAKERRDQRTAARQRVICAGCGESFTPQRLGARTCSNQCRARLFRRRKSGKS
jgi:hypothetical protein